MQAESLHVIEATVRGHVQGVGFRVFVSAAAEELGLSGYVRNQADGSVYVVALGQSAPLEELVRRLHSGPKAAKVSGVELRRLGAVPARFPAGFEVRR